jgi:protein-S-isoprenylcysteine O-methyltransferase Ste14
MSRKFHKTSSSNLSNSNLFWLFERAFWFLLNLLSTTTTFVYFGWVAELPFVSTFQSLDLLTRFLNYLLSGTVPQFHYLPAKVVWNLSLQLLFGFIHSLLAQNFVHQLLLKFVPLHAVRTLFIFSTALSVSLVMIYNQHLGIVVWSFCGENFSLCGLLNTLFFLFFMGFIFYTLTFFDPLMFFGIRQLLMPERATTSDHPPKLFTSGLYAWIRHPIYTFTLAAFLLTPYMTLNRLVIVCGMFLYLSVGIYFEEKKLIATFGKEYELYRNKVPALVPFLF